MPTLSRSELYAEVWSTPMRRLATKYGISDVGLAKICAKHKIPRPQRGYWAKLEAGYRPAQRPLPDPDRDAKIELREPQSQRSLDAELQGEIDAARAPEKPIVVAADLRGGHEVVRRAKQELETAETDGCGILVPPENASLDVRTSKAQVRRALLIADALLKAADSRGFATSPGPLIEAFGQQVGFRVEEELQSVKENEELELTGYYQFGHSRFRYSRVPSGALAIKLRDGERSWANGLRKSWRDTPKRRLEDGLDAVFVGLLAAAAQKSEWEAAEAEQRRATAEAKRLREELAQARAERRKLQAAEQARVDEVLGQASDWRKAETLRKFVDAVRAMHATNGEIDPGSDIAAWIAWARMQADRIDPLKESPPSILDEIIPSEESRRW